MSGRYTQKKWRAGTRVLRGHLLYWPYSHVKTSIIIIRPPDLPNLFHVKKTTLITYWFLHHYHATADFILITPCNWESETAGNQSPLYQTARWPIWDFQLMFALAALFKQCTHCITGNTDVRWKQNAAEK